MSMGLIFRKFYIAPALLKLPSLELELTFSRHFKKNLLKNEPTDYVVSQCSWEKKGDPLVLSVSRLLSLGTDGLDH